MVNKKKEYLKSKKETLARIKNTETQKVSISSSPLIKFNYFNLDSKYPVSLIVALIYGMALSFIAIKYFEPWRDLAHLWVSTRDSSIFDLLFKIPVGAVPSLWSLFIKPLTMVHAPYISSIVLNIWACAAAVYLLLRYAPLPYYLKILFVLSYPLIYEFPFPGRIYGFGALLVFLICALYPVRKKSPVLFSVALAGLMHTHPIYLGFLVPIGAFFAWEIFFDKLITPSKKIYSFGILILSGIYFLWYVFQGQKFAKLVKVGAKKDFFPSTLSQSFLADAGLSWILALGLLISLLLLFYKYRTIIMFSFMLIFSFYMYHEVTPNFIRYFLMLPVMTIGLLWVHSLQFKLTGFYKNNFEKRIYTGSAIIFALCCCLSAKNGLIMLSREIKEPHSYSEEAGKFINEHYPQHTIIGHRCYTASAVVPYLKNQQSIWMADEEKFVSYIMGDSLYYQTAFKYSYPEALQNALKKFPYEKKLILLFSIPLPPEYSKGWKLVYQSEKRPIQYDEVYFIYEKI
ncbi:MAG: hypothetical protein ABI761_08455 [Saprospiraceae bacterium]